MNNDKNLVIIRSVFGKVGQKYFLNPARDPRTGLFPPCVRSVDSRGDMILSETDKNGGEALIPENKVFIVESGDSFNLNDKYQKAAWESIQFSPIIALSRDARDAKGNLLIDGEKAEGKTHARYGFAELYVEKPDQEMERKVSKRKLIHDAETYIYEDSAEGRMTKARILGRNMKGATDNEIIDYLIDIANKVPSKIKNIYTSSTLGLNILLIDAKDKGVIHIKNKYYMYGDDTILGVTDDAVIVWLGSPKNAKIVERIRQDTYPELYSKEK